MSDAGALSILNISESHSQPFSSSLSISFHFCTMLCFFCAGHPNYWRFGGNGRSFGPVAPSVDSSGSIPVAFSRRKPLRYSAVRLAKLNFILEGDCKGLGRLFGAEFADVQVYVD
jgi:hypothetical protein